MDLHDERLNACLPLPASILACGNLALPQFALTPEDINFRCNNNANFGHGTAMAAIAAGRKYPRCVDPNCMQQGLDGWDGVAPEASIYSFKITDDMTPNSGARDSTIIASVQQALQNNCHVYNYSFDGDWDPIGPTTQAFDNAGLADMVVCVIAGNCGGPVTACPAFGPNQPTIRHSLFNGFIVGATAKWTPPPPSAFANCFAAEFADTLAEYSSRGPLTDFINVPPLPWVRTGLNLTGPSGQVASGNPTSACPPALPGCNLPNWTPQVCTRTEVETVMIDASYTYAVLPGVPPTAIPPFPQRPPKLDVGTSGATAFVSGAAALVRQANLALTALEVRAILLNEANDRRVRLANPTLGPNDFGLGRVDVVGSVLAALEGRVQFGLIEPPVNGTHASIPVDLPADHDVEATLVWDRVDVTQPQASDLRFNVLDPGSAPVANASVLSGANPDGIVQPDDNFRHFAFRTTVAGTYTLRAVGTTFRLPTGGPFQLEAFPFAVSWRNTPAPIDPAATMLPNSTILTSLPSVSGVTHPAVGDFNLDGQRDVAANVIGGATIWWKGPGFQPQQPTGFVGGSRLVTSIVDTDALDDVVTGVSTTAYVGRGAAPRPFPGTLQSTLGVSFDPFRHAVADLHCPPVPPTGYFPVADLALLATQGAPPSSTDLVVHAGGGTGLFVSPPTLVSALDHDLRGLVGGDFDADGCPDLVAVGVRSDSAPGQPQRAGALVCFRGLGSLAFDNPSFSGTISYFPEFLDPTQSALCMVAEDFDRDGRLDVAVVSAMRFLPPGVTLPVRLIVFAGDGAGHFSRIAEAPAWLDVTGGPGVATANPFTVRHGIGVEADGASPLDVALLGDDAGGTPALRVFAIDTLGHPYRREGYPISPNLMVPTSLAAKGNLLGGLLEDIVVGGGPNPSGFAVVEVRRD